MRQSFTHFDCACQGRTSERAARVAGGEPAGACRVSSREAPSSTLAAVKRRRVRRHPTRLSRRHKPVPPRSCRLRGKTAARDRGADSGARVSCRAGRATHSRQDTLVPAGLRVLCRLDAHPASTPLRRVSTLARARVVSRRLSQQHVTACSS